MLTFLGGRSRFCDGVTRRGFLRAGAASLGAATLTLADAYRADAAAARRQPGSASRHKAVINVFLAGGPPHLDTWDPKPDAPAEVRGEFRAIPTRVDGVRVGECFPLVAAMMDKFAVVRSVVGAKGGHDAHQCMTGWDPASLSAMGGRPAIGAAAARLQGAVDPAVPPFVGLSSPTAHAPWGDPGRAGFLGPAAAPFRPSGPDLANMVMNAANREHLGDRRKLLDAFDDARRTLDAAGPLAAMDAHTERALDLLTSSRVVDALDLSREDPALRARYGTGRPYRFQMDGAPTDNEQLLVARRLVEAGVRVVSLSYGRWDAHADGFATVRDHGAKLDQCLSALVSDLDDRGMLNDVTVIAWGEFGRTPRVNAQGGRDHWPQVNAAIVAGGGLRTGQAVGSTDRLGESVRDRPVTFGDVFATLYHALGIDPRSTTVPDPTGRPQPVVEGTPIRELVGSG